MAAITKRATTSSFKKCWQFLRASILSRSTFVFYRTETDFDEENKHEKQGYHFLSIVKEIKRCKFQLEIKSKVLEIKASSFLSTIFWFTQ